MVSSLSGPNELITSCFFKSVVGNKEESADKPPESVLQGADLCHIMAAVFAGWGSTVAAVYTIALFDQNP